MPTFGNQQGVDFEKEILPIFRQHCFECHGEGNTEGELSLESVDAIRRGGHTGSPILSAELGNSELYLRITSLSDGYRMPKKGKPLPSGDVDKIGNWIQQVSQGVPDDLFVSSASQGKPVTQDVARKESGPASSGPFGLIDGMQPAQIATFAIATIIILMLIFWFLLRMTAGKAGKRKFSRHMGRTKAFAAMVIGIVSSVILGALGYFYWRTGELVKENQALRAELRIHSPKIPPVIEINRSNLPLPPHPMHPPRLGGQYYRGNDERDPALFNGGFYRTATIDLNLADSTGSRLEWGSDASGDLSVEINIQRAPNATKELFSQRVLNSLSLQHYCQTDSTLDGSMNFEVVEHEERWTVKVPIPKVGQWKNDRAEGMIYMMYGVQPGEARAPRPHFAIRYDLRHSGGTISKESELWMGSMYTLGGRVLVPDEKKILLDRWFDWRPIPVIEGKVSSDPKLLGTEEHLGDK